MSTFMLYRVPNNTFKPSQWTKTIIWTLQEYTYSQWISHNTFVHGATHSASGATLRLSLMTQITEAYNIIFSIQSMNCHSHLVFCLHSSQSKTLTLWKLGSFSFKLAKRDQPIYSNKSAVTKAISQNSSSSVSVVAALRNHLIMKQHKYILLTFQLEPHGSSATNKPTRSALSQCTSKFNSYLLFNRPNIGIGNLTDTVVNQSPSLACGKITLPCSLGAKMTTINCFLRQG